MRISTRKLIKILSGKAPGSLPETWPQKTSLKHPTNLAEHFGFLPRPSTPMAAFMFVTKGGVLKTSLTLNLARLAALHGIKTLVIGLDVQCDISRALGGFSETENLKLEEALASIDQVQGLFQFYQGEASLQDLITPTDLPHLHYICETPELATLEQALHLRPRREMWLKEAVIEPLKSQFDLILLDGAPSWSLLTTNALSACDALISPVECKINNFRNLNMFRAFIHDFKRDMRTDFPHIFIPTRLSPNRRLSRDIYERYLSELPACVRTPLKDSVQGEESSALKLSVCEHAPTSMAAQEMRSALHETFILLQAQTRNLNSTLKFSEKEAFHVPQS